MEELQFPRRRRLITTAAPRCREEDIIAFAHRLGFRPDEAQCVVLRSTAGRVILNCTRQWGKTSVSVVRALHCALSVRGSLVVVASPGLRQSGEWMRKAAEMIWRLGIPKRGDGYNRLSLLLPGNSRIVGLPDAETRIRGYSAPSMILIDEAARVTDKTYHALRPMLSVGSGVLWMMSTPWGKRGFFYETWADGGPEWCRMSVNAADCPRIAKEFLEEQRAVMGAESFRQEHMCQFTSSGTEVFNRALVEAAIDYDLEPL